jgi:putative FmdB family regulatory protein
VPIYEYRCLACKKRTSVFVRTVSTPVKGAACEHCGAKKLQRLFSRVAVHRGAVSLDDDAAMDSFDENDPRAMARLMRQMGEEAGEDMGPEMEQMISRLEAGEDPESVMSDAEGGMGEDYGDDDF